MSKRIKKFSAKIEGPREQANVVASRILSVRDTGGSHLDLGKLDLRELPEEIGWLTWLKSLDVRDNRLTTLPNAICRMDHLSLLEARNNHLTELPESIGR